MQRAARLPLAPDAALHIVHAVPDDVPAAVRDRVEANARRQLGQAADAAARSSARAGNVSLAISPELVHGRGHVEIIRKARAHDVDLIVLGRHGRRPVHDLFLGSTAERVARMSGLPVLVVNTRSERPYQRAVVAIELSDVARRIVELASQLIEPELGVCWLVHAFHIPFEGMMRSALAPRAMAAYRAESRDNAAAELERLVGPLGDAATRRKPVLRAGSPESVIAGEAARRRADLVAIGTHARSGLAHALLGSVATWVLRNVACDVVVARPTRFTFEPP